MSKLKSKQLTYPLSGSFTGSLFGTASYALSGSGGGGIPGGNNYEIQFNNNGVFGGIPVLTYSASILVGTGSFSGSFTGLIDSASYAATASYAPDYLLISETGSMTVLSASYASSSLSASYSISSSYSDFSISSSYSQTSSYSLDALSSSYAATASYAPDYLPLTGGTITGDLTVTGTGSFSYLHVTYESASVIYSSGSNQFGDADDDVQTLYGAVNIPAGSLTVSGSTTITGSLIVTSGITGSLYGTSSFAISASYAVSSSYAESSSYALTASYIQTAQTASYVLNAVSSSYALTASYSVSSSFATTAQSAPLYVLTADTASMTVLSSSYAVTASYIETAQTASYVLNAVSSSIASTASYVTASNVYGPFGSDSVISSSYALTASYALNGGGGGSGAGFPFTGSAVITGSLIVTGSATFTDSIMIDATLVTSSLVNTTGGTTIISTQATGSYRAMFAKYTVSNVGNARAGEFMAVWNGANIQYTDTSTTDIGDTSAVVLIGSLTTTDIQLSTGVEAGWTVKTQTTYI